MYTRFVHFLSLSRIPFILIQLQFVDEILSTTMMTKMYSRQQLFINFVQYRGEYIRLFLNYLCFQMVDYIVHHFIKINKVELNKILGVFI